MKKIELVLSRTYLYKGKVFERHPDGPARAYAVTDRDAGHLLAQVSETGVPYFRLSDSSQPVIPSHKREDKGGKPQLAKTEEAPQDIEVEVDEEVEDDEVIEAVVEEEDEEEVLEADDDDDEVVSV